MLPPSGASLLEGSAFFAALSSEVREDLARRLTRAEFGEGTVIVREGDAGNDYYLVASGMAEVWVAKEPASVLSVPSDGATVWQPDPKRFILLGRLGPGDGFGEMALLLGGPRRATVRAATPLVAYTIDGAIFRAVVAGHRGLTLALEEEMALRASAIVLGRSSPFANLPAETLRWLALRVETVTCEAGQEIIREGDPADAFYLVQSGRVGVVGRREDGTEYSIATLGPGSPFGEQALVTGEPRSATVRALEPTTLLRLGRDGFLAVLAEYPERAAYFRQLTLQRQRPRRIARWAIEKQVGRDGVAVYVLKDVDRHRYLKLSEQGAFLWELMDGEHSIYDLSLAFFLRYRVFGLNTVVDAVRQFHVAGFVRIRGLDPPVPARSASAGRLRRLLALAGRWATRYFSLPEVDPAVTQLYGLLRPLFSRPAQVLLLLVTLAGSGVFLHYLLLGDRSAVGAGATLGGFALAIVLGDLLHVFLHELAHAVTCKHFGREVHRAGVGWYLFLPVAFVDTSDMWLGDKWQRIAVSAAGPYTNFVLSGLASLTIPLLTDARLQSALFEFAAIGYLLGLPNLNPFVELDGYFILMDWLQIPSLRAKALAFLGSVVWGVERTTRDERLARLYTFYSALALLYTVVIAALVLVTYRGYFQQLVASVLPALASGILGWAVAALMAGLVLLTAWGDVRKGARTISASQDVGSQEPGVA
jgi:putative peptide zinc metalloprotease protein